MKPLTVAGIVLGGLGLAFVVHKATQSAGDKAAKGSTVKVPMTSLSLVTSGGFSPIPGVQANDVATVLVTSSDADNLYGTVQSVANPSGSIGVPARLAGAVSVALPRNAVLA
jgi:hypothetical protein